MKTTIYTIITLFILSSCNLTDSSDVFDSDKLIGKYKVDLKPYVNETVKTEKEDDGWSKIGKGLAGLALSAIDIELNFYEDNKGLMHMDGGLMDFANAFSDEPIQQLQEFEYKVEDDSIIFIKMKDKKDFKKWAIIKKFSPNYDYLQFLMIDEEKDMVFFNLKKISE